MIFKLLVMEVFQGKNNWLPWNLVHVHTHMHGHTQGMEEVVNWEEEQEEEKGKE